MLIPTSVSRGTTLVGALILAGCGLTLTPAQAAEPGPYAKINAAAASSEIVTHPLRANVSMLEGSGGNIAVLSGPDGLFLGDVGIAVSKDKIVAALKAINPGPIRYVVNTHWHWDHTDGNGWARASGATVVAHAQTIKHLKQTIRVDEWDHTFTPVPAAELPTVAVTAPKTMTFGGETIHVQPYSKGHTDGDLSVYFVKADVLLTGDTFWNGVYPFIDYHVHGSIDGQISAANDDIARSKPSTIIIPGHGPLATQAQLIAWRDMLVGVRGKVAALKAQGKTVEEVIAAKPTATYDGDWNNPLFSPDVFTALVYEGV